MRHNRLQLGAGTLAVALALGMFGGIAGAQAPPKSPPAAGTTSPHPVQVTGRVASVSGTGLMLVTPRGRATVNVGPNTWIVVQQADRTCIEGTLTDIQANKPAVVAGMTAGQQGTINARTVIQGRCNAQNTRPAAKIAEHAAAGTIKAINGSTITIASERGTDVNINTTSNTVVLSSGFKSTGTLKVGDRVEVLGQPVKNADKSAQVARTINAWALRVVTPNSAIMIGSVQSITGNTVTLSTPRNRAGVTVTLDGSTAYRLLTQTQSGTGPTLGNATQADVKTGSRIIVEGISSSDGKSLSAKAVIVLPDAKAGSEKPAKPGKP